MQPHVHALITDTCWDREGNAQPIPDMDIADKHGIEKLFAGLVFKMLLEKGMIVEELVDNMRSWKHSGFSVHCSKPIKTDDPHPQKGSEAGYPLRGSTERFEVMRLLFVFRLKEDSGKWGQCKAY